MKNIYLLSVLMISIPFVVNAQISTDAIIVKLNKIHKTGRIFGNRVTTIFMNKSDNTLDMDGSVFPIDQVKMNYEFRSDQKINKNAVTIRCTESGCFTNKGEYNSGLITTSAITIFFKTKEASYQFINLFADLQKSINY